MQEREASPGKEKAGSFQPQTLRQEKPASAATCHVTKSPLSPRGTWGTSTSHGPRAIRPIWVLGGNEGAATWGFLFPARPHRPDPAALTSGSPGVLPQAHPTSALQQTARGPTSCDPRGRWLGVVPPVLSSRGHLRSPASWGGLLGLGGGIHSFPITCLGTSESWGTGP